MISRVEQWPERPACLDHDPELFFPHPGNKKGIQLAKAVCDECPARLRCTLTAMENRERDGVWGGAFLNGRPFSKKERDRAQAQTLS